MNLLANFCLIGLDFVVSLRPERSTELTPKSHAGAPSNKNTAYRDTEACDVRPAMFEVDISGKSL